jgi:hypothetical protein
VQLFCELRISLMDNPVQSQEIAMIKSVLMATAICFAFVVPASAQTTVKCDEASLMQMRKDIDAMTDKEKQKIVLGNWEAANTAFKANKMEECNARVADTSKSMIDAGVGKGGGSGDNALDAPGPDNGTTTQ